MCSMGRWWRGIASIGGMGCFRRSVLLSRREFTLLLLLFCCGGGPLDSWDALDVSLIEWLVCDGVEFTDFRWEMGRGDGIGCLSSVSDEAVLTVPY